MIDIRASVKKLLKDKFDTDPDLIDRMFELGMLKEHECRGMLIRDEYTRKIKPKESERLRHMLAAKYCVSERYVRKVLYESIP